MIRANFQHLNEEQVLALPQTPNCGIMELQIDRKVSPRGRLEVAIYK